MSNAMMHAFVLETVVMVVAAPLGGVAAVLRRGPAWPIVRLLVSGATLFVLASAAVAAASGGRGSLPLVAISHATLWAATLALAALGALCGSLFPDPLDAAAGALGLAIVAAAGALVLGPAIADASSGAIDLALMANPIVAAASAANIDLLRTEPLYRLSPLAHVRFDYPAWQTAFACYAGFALVCFFAMALNLARRNRTHLIERIAQ